MPFIIHKVSTLVFGVLANKGFRVVCCHHLMTNLQRGHVWHGQLHDFFKRPGPHLVNRLDVVPRRKCPTLRGELGRGIGDNSSLWVQFGHDLVDLLAGLLHPRFSIQVEAQLTSSPESKTSLDLRVF